MAAATAAAEIVRTATAVAVGKIKMENSNFKMTSSLEDYLEAIFLLSQINERVRLTSVAEKLGVSKPSVNRAVKTLTDNGFLEHAIYGDIIMTPFGESYAADVLRRHRLLKSFLIDILGVDEINAEADACKMEHVISSATIDKLCDYLNEQG